MNQALHYTPGLYITATPIGNMGDITLRALDALGKVDAIACEDTRETGKLLAGHGIKAEGRLIAYHEHNADKMRPKIMDMIAKGQSVALVSDAGMPLVSDPGYRLVRDCREKGLTVTCLPGASATLAALVLSGLPTDRFFFAGFLPPKSGARKTALAEISAVPATLIFYETGPRLANSLSDMVTVLGDRAATVLRELTKKFEETRHGTLATLAAHYKDSGPPRGEIVIVIEGPVAKPPASAEEVDQRLQTLILKEKMSTKDAAAQIAAETGWKKKDVYAQAVKISQSS
ncbi:MAG: 16S rRNA (cytidine(1402)-2'-O)-methyltransferase [Alphaproteobacteria bacterium]|nr:16S rRNA (cytidine(1402)-2'-O)-methyltransferase [Alphaproteobacteria bacterium]